MARAALLLLLSLFGTAPLLACSGSCVDDDDCALNACRTCETGFGVCADCCEYQNQFACPPACTWDDPTQQCRNISTDSCANLLNDVPVKPRQWLFALFPLLLAVPFVGLRLRRRKRN